MKRIRADEEKQEKSVPVVLRRKKSNQFLRYTKSLRALATDPDYERDRQSCVAARAYLHQGNWGACAPLFTDSEPNSSYTQATLRIRTDSLDESGNGLELFEKVRKAEGYNGSNTARETYSQCRKRVRALFIDSGLPVS
jgi:hypothetical protein